jgi:hypothetical protein
MCLIRGCLCCRGMGELEGSVCGLDVEGLTRLGDI